MKKDRFFLDPFLKQVSHFNWCLKIPEGCVAHNRNTCHVYILLEVFLNTESEVGRKDLLILQMENSASNNRSPSLWSTVIKSIGFWNLVLVFFPAVLAGVCRMIQQVLLLYILTLMTAGIHNWNLWVCTGAFLIFLSMEIVAKNQYFYNTQYALRTRITSGMISLVYRKVSVIRFLMFISSCLFYMRSFIIGNETLSRASLQKFNSSAAFFQFW